MKEQIARDLLSIGAVFFRMNPSFGRAVSKAPYTVTIG